VDKGIKEQKKYLEKIVAGATIFLYNNMVVTTTILKEIYKEGVDIE